MPPYGRRKKTVAAAAAIRSNLKPDAELPVEFVNDMSELRGGYTPFKVLEDYIPEEASGEGHPSASSHPSVGNGAHHVDVSSHNSPPSFPPVEPLPGASVSSRPGWALRRCSEDAPYALLQRRDLFERCVYMMDAADDAWCAAHGVPTAFFTEAITLLERSYARALLRAASDPPPAVGAERCGVCAREGRLLRCSLCRCASHAHCWLLDRPPPAALEARWRCAGCASLRRAAVVRRCHACGRSGGAMIPFASAAPLLCHIVCALAAEAFAIDASRRVVRAGGRRKRMRAASHCALCQGGAPTALCGHPGCVAALHPSCAQEAGAIECRPADGTCRLFCRAHVGAVSGGDGAEAVAMGRVSPADLRGAALRVGEDRRDAPRRQGRPRKDAVAHLEAVKGYWRDKRAQRAEEGDGAVREIAERRRDFVSVVFRPEVVKVSQTEARRARFVCLIPELQHHINAVVEGVLQLPDDEYEDVQEYRKGHTRTRHTGNTAKLYEKMQLISEHIHVFRELTGLIHERAVLERQLVKMDLKLLDAQCQWKNTK